MKDYAGKLPFPGGSNSAVKGNEDRSDVIIIRTDLTNDMAHALVEALLRPYGLHGAINQPGGAFTRCLRISSGGEAKQLHEAADKVGKVS